MGARFQCLMCAWQNTLAWRHLRWYFFQCWALVRKFVVSLLENSEHCRMIGCVFPEILSSEDGIIHGCQAVLQIFNIGVKLCNEYMIKACHLADLWICKLLEGWIPHEPVLDAKQLKGLQIGISPLGPRSFVLHADEEQDIKEGFEVMLWAVTKYPLSPQDLKCHEWGCSLSNI